MLILLLPILLSYVRAEPPLSQENFPSSQDAVTNFEPSLAVVIGILLLMLILTFILLCYAKCCNMPASIHNNQNLDGLIAAGARPSGVDKTVIESLPFFRFSSLGGSRQGLECAVCLSRFEDIEILRLLPKCKHAFHIDCIDQWLEKHSSCPLCRHRITPEDLASSSNLSNSFRFMRSQRELREDSNLELFVQREESQDGFSSRCSIGNSLTDRARKEEELPIQGYPDHNLDQKALHKFNHRIVVADVVLKNRWSNVSSSDLIFLNSEMIGAVSSRRLSSIESNSEQAVTSCGVEDGPVMKIKEEMERKRVFESKASKMNKTNPAALTGGSDASSQPLRVLNPNEKRSMSEITVHPRFRELSLTNVIRGYSSHPENSNREERVKRIWLPIARRTAQWFANRERRSQQPQNTRESLNV
ncbi:hypothetical protein NMG60_11013445 [Bertholletia excelsa]